MKKDRLSLALFLVIIALVVGSTALEVMTRHNEKLLMVASKKIEEASRQCYIEGKCTGDTTTLETIIKEGYIDPQVHPISKEFIGEDLVIVCKEYTCKTNLT